MTQTLGHSLMYANRHAVNKTERQADTDRVRQTEVGGCKQALRLADTCTEGLMDSKDNLNAIPARR